MSNYQFDDITRKTYARNVNYFLETLVVDYGSKDNNDMAIEINPNLEVRLLEIPGIDKPKLEEIKDLISGALASLMNNLENGNDHPNANMLAADEFQLTCGDYIQYVTQNNKFSHRYLSQRDYNNFLPIPSRDCQLKKLTPNYASQILNLKINEPNIKTLDDSIKWINQQNFYAEIGSKLPLGIISLTGEFLGLFIITNLEDNNLHYNLWLLESLEIPKYQDLNRRVVRVIEDWLERHYPEKKLEVK